MKPRYASVTAVTRTTTTWSMLKVLMHMLSQDTPDSTWPLPATKTRTSSLMPTIFCHQFTTGNVTNGQTLMFGLTGGLIPCPAAITVLLMFLQLKKITLGAALVMGFSIGLALPLVLPEWLLP